MEKSLALDFNVFREVNTSLTKEDISMMSPLQLAYVGDAVYELFIRTLILKRDQNAKLLHKNATGYVSASSQAELLHEFYEMLDDDEKKVVLKGRNAKTNTSPKNADLIDYKYATGLECLFGYLYLLGNDKRLAELFNNIIRIKS
ncbi:MAG: ribonuclease III domain-containing protein [Gudongella sp.]|jgi:ribonuclease-3 family protein|nr:ribonuclease III domain-containing protein [Gudongella sp.]